jgi:ubiquinone/menaquinone biosynthesis C-methylase UbiE
LADRGHDHLLVELTRADARAPERWLPILQGALRPNGVADLRLRENRERLALARVARHYFDVEAGPSQGILRVRRRSTAAGTSHFESLAPHYWAQIPAHVQDHFLTKKTDLLQEVLPPRAGLVGLDLGCGVGRYAQAVQERVGGRVVGLDPVQAALGEARHNLGTRVDLLCGDVLRLPFKDHSLDYAYTINVLHHLKRGEQERGLQELRRVLKPDGVLIVHEMNTRNPLFSWYLRHVFPKVRPIDRGDEEFIDPRHWPLGDAFRLQTLRFMTFVPDFAPRWSLGALRRVERWLERGATSPYSIHYAAVLRPQ